MTRSDILLDSRDVLEKLEDQKDRETVIKMSQILDDLWLMMIKLEEYEDMKPLEGLMQKCFKEAI